MKTDNLGRPLSKKKSMGWLAVCEAIVAGRPYTALGNYFTHLPVGRTKQQALQRGAK